MSKYQPKAVTIFPWLKSNLGPRALAPLTGTDTRALRAAVEIIELYSVDHNPVVIEAFGNVVSQMQRSTMHLAFHGIAHVLDWGDRLNIWVMAGLPEIDPGKCSFEPGGLYFDLSKKQPSVT